ncbi:MAG TPA: glycosyltransferase, partial [Gemmatales bacterium]|nr:glycosyltransferase [Gemmatales bacterium]
MDRTPVADQPLSVVVPAYQATAVLPSLMADLRSVLDKLKRANEVIVVDDASSDGSSDWLRRQADSWPSLRVTYLDK